MADNPKIASKTASKTGTKTGSKKRTTTAKPAAAPAPAQDDKTLELMRMQIAASLASGMIAASGRSHTAKEAADLLTDVQYTLFPRQKNSKYKEWLAGHNADTPHR